MIYKPAAPVPIVVVQGSQWGSEGKGTIAASLCMSRDIRIAVRTGGINAGHTVRYHGKTFKMQQLPCGWINPRTELVLGAGALIHPETLLREIFMVDEIMQPLTGDTVMARLSIDNNASVHGEIDQEISKQTGRHHSIGATGKGVSEAIARKILDRGKGYEGTLFKAFAKNHLPAHRFHFVDTADKLNFYYDAGGRILIEGTQGQMLDLHLGPWPYTTGRGTSVSAQLGELGLSPRLNYEIVAVTRTYPIRVAGNSGPMPQEISWPILVREMNAKLTAEMAPFVSEDELRSWEMAVRHVSQRYATPLGSDGLDQHEWGEADRFKCQVGLSEIHAQALEWLRQHDVASYNSVMDTFEMTTVTKKLRRIARLDYPSLIHSFAVDRPSWVALTFLNYVFPRLWGMKADDENREKRLIEAGAATYINEFVNATNVPVRMVTTGPHLDEVLDSSVPMDASRVAHV